MKILIFILTFSLSSIASLKDAERVYNQRGDGASKYANIAIELVKSKFYYSALPFAKEAIIRGISNQAFDRTLEELIFVTGIKVFEVMPSSSLARSNSGSVAYILAKKSFSDGNYKKSLVYLDRVKPNHRFYAFALNMRASIYSLNKDLSRAQDYYDKCIAESRSWANDVKNPQRKLEYRNNEGYCIAGKARALFNKGKHEEADLAYLDLPKSSYIWPEILLEEAWNSYHQKNYNRSLGKIVTYQAPLLNYFFTPEADVLKAMSYFRLCLYQDAKSTANNFYKKYERDIKKVKNFLLRNGSSTSKYFDLLNKGSRNQLLNRLIKKIRKETAMQQMLAALDGIINESKVVGTQLSGRFAAVLRDSMRQTLSSQKRIMGGYTRSRLRFNYLQFVQAFEGMSYLKLEILKKRKERLYSNKKQDEGKRGDIQFVERNAKQYFWDFNGEFWADELGDYVFALRSEC